MIKSAQKYFLYYILIFLFCSYWFAYMLAHLAAHNSLQACPALNTSGGGGVTPIVSNLAYHFSFPLFILSANQRLWGDVCSPFGKMLECPAWLCGILRIQSTRRGLEECSVWPTDGNVCLEHFLSSQMVVKLWSFFFFFFLNTMPYPWVVAKFVFCSVTQYCLLNKVHFTCFFCCCFF